MPNHFHLMVLVNEIELPSTHRVTSSHPVSNRNINNSIAILLRSYTRAINKQEKKSGALFRESTKAECINCFKDIKPSFIQSNMLINNLINEKQYPQICFNYIHQNPVNAKLVKNATDWEFSSALDYRGLRNGKIVNKNIAKEYVNF
jgi:putative transposase